MFPNIGRLHRRLSGGILYIPVLFLPMFSFNDPIYTAFPLKEFTLQWYAEMSQNSALLTALENSFKLGLVVICMPCSILVMISRPVGFVKGLEEAAQDIGETPWMTFWLITFSLALPGIVASLLLCFTISSDEFLLAFFLLGDQQILPVYIWSQLRFPASLLNVLALGSCILLTSVTIVVLAEWVRRIGAAPSSKGAQQP